MAEGVPYYKPQAPEVPVADNTAAKIIANTDLTGDYLKGLTAFTSIALKRKEMELEQSRYLADSDLKARQMDQAQQTIDSTHEYHKALIDKANQVSGVKTNSDAAMFNSLMDNNMKIANFNTEAQKRADELKLDDPQFKTESPVEFAQALNTYKQEYGFAPSYTGIGQKIKTWQTQADQQKITVNFGAQSKDGKWEGGRPVTTPIWKVIQGIQDPNQTEMYMNGLEAAGHLGTEQKTTTTQDTPSDLQGWLNGHFGTNFGTGKTETTTDVGKWDAPASRLFEKSATTDFTTQSASRVPANLPRTPPRQNIRLGFMPDSSVATGPEYVSGTLERNMDAQNAAAPTDSDVMLQQARAALEQGYDRDAVIGLLQQKGIDPSGL